MSLELSLFPTLSLQAAPNLKSERGLVLLSKPPRPHPYCSEIYLEPTVKKQAILKNLHIIISVGAQVTRLNRLKCLSAQEAVTAGASDSPPIQPGFNSQLGI